MTVETRSIFPSASETAKTALQSSMPPEPSRATVQRFMVREAEPPPQWLTPSRWPRVFPGL